MLDAPEFYAFSFRANDCNIASQLYSQIFDGTIIQSSVPHSELLLQNQIRIIFSKESENCPVQPGTLVFRLDSTRWPKWTELLVSNGFVLEATLERYISFLDPWKNRIWLFDSGEG
ncbi:hypothetical protein CH373_15330 [Leptospira perolatii]|uniref:Glyoxalase n=1 Tax=Leptospira perolatii TaxID=2023191 RepID=A0A2M9ZJV2_9LEPT|nr:hypothetical protein [Leptospira perolatii]PJZ69555.1 hypothetical protein CH360_10670 [Leptospira perolatii]PJZ72322.1 hypothetical protein CH373_15330 [Leptospira perolatii]